MCSAAPLPKARGATGRRTSGGTDLSDITAGVGLTTLLVFGISWESWRHERLCHRYRGTLTDYLREPASEQAIAHAVSMSVAARPTTRSTLATSLLSRVRVMLWGGWSTVTDCGGGSTCTGKLGIGCSFTSRATTRAITAPSTR